MESLAYLLNKNFVLVAVDTNYEDEFGGLKIEMNRAKKVYKLNDQHLISVIGNPYKITDIYKYILKLNELEHNTSFENIIADLNDVFNSSKIDVVKEVQHLTNILPRFYDANGYIKMPQLLDHLKDKPDFISILTEAISSINNSHPALTQILLFAWETEKQKIRISHLISLGQNLVSSSDSELLTDSVYLKFVSSSIDATNTTKMESEAIQNITPFLQSGWDIKIDSIDNVIEKGKQILTEGLNKITPYKKVPNVVFYELSQRTNYTFQEPSIDLKKIEYNR